MSKAASGKAMKLGIPSYEPPTTMEVNLKKHKALDVHDVGATVHFNGKGKVVSKSKHENGSHRMSIEINSLDRAVKGPLQEAKEAS